MAASGKKNMFNEATRVQMPAMVHLTRLGYTYFGKITEDMAGTVYDPDTNILINVFKEQFARLNPTHAGAALEIYCVACAVSRGFKCFRFYSFLIIGVRMWSVLIGRFHTYCTCRHLGFR